MRCAQCGRKDYTAERLHTELLREKETVRKLQRELETAKSQWENWHDIAIENEISEAHYRKAIEDALAYKSTHDPDVDISAILDILSEAIK